MESNSKNNYFPSYECGSCSEHLAFVYDYITRDDLIARACENCHLYKKQIKVLGQNLYTYRNIFIEKINLSSTVVSGFGFRVKNRDTIHFDILNACDDIDEEIANV